MPAPDSWLYTIVELEKYHLDHALIEATHTVPLSSMEPIVCSLI